jgi:hypothetical protein
MARAVNCCMHSAAQRHSARCLTLHRGGTVSIQRSPLIIQEYTCYYSDLQVFYRHGCIRPGDCWNEHDRAVHSSGQLWIKGLEFTVHACQLRLFSRHRHALLLKPRFELHSCLQSNLGSPFTSPLHTRLSHAVIGGRRDAVTGGLMGCADRWAHSGMHRDAQGCTGMH